MKGQAEVSFEVKGGILYHIYKHPFVNGGKAGVALWPLFYVASYCPTNMSRHLRHVSLGGRTCGT